MDVPVGERHDARPVVARAVHGDAVDLRQLVDRHLGERLLVLGDPLQADGLEVVDRGGEPHGALHVRRPRLELVRDLVVGRMVVPYARDHLTAAVVGRHRLEQGWLRDQRAGAHGGEHLVTRERVEVAVEQLHVDVEVRRGLRAVHHDGGAHGVRQPGELRRRVHGAERVRDEGEGHDLGAPLQGPAEIRQIDPPVVRELDHPQRGTLLLTQDLPRHEVRVVVHRRHHHGVARAHVGAAVGARDQVQGLGRAAREYDALGRPGVHEPRDLRTRGLVGLRGADRETVRPPMHVGVGGAVVVGDGGEHRLGLLRRRCVVEVDEPVAVLLLLEQREVGADPGGVEHHAARRRSAPPPANQVRTR